MLQTALKNWKTTGAGVLLIVLSGLSMIGIHIPGFTDPGMGAAITAGIGLIVAGDSAVSK
jgi:hypothetical protein